MAKPPSPPEVPVEPEDFPQTTPRDLYATSDIRFVMLEIGKLTMGMAGLKELVDKQGTKLDDISHKVSFVRGAMWVIGGLLALIGILFAAYLCGIS